MIVTNDSYPFMAVNHGRIVWLVMGLIWFILWLFIRLRSKKTPIYRLFTYIYQLNMVIVHSKLLNYQRVNGFVRKWPGEAYTAKKKNTTISLLLWVKSLFKPWYQTRPINLEKFYSGRSIGGFNHLEKY